MYPKKWDILEYDQLCQLVRKVSYTEKVIKSYILYHVLGALAMIVKVSFYLMPWNPLTHVHTAHERKDMVFAASVFSLRFRLVGSERFTKDPDLFARVFVAIADRVQACAVYPLAHKEVEGLICGC